MERYELVYDFCDEYGNEDTNITETMDVSGWGELQECIKMMRKNGCYNINATHLYSYEEVLGG